MTRVVIISILIAVLGFIPLMGIPGALVFMLAKPFVFLSYGPMAFEAFNQSLGDSTWPLMLMLTILWPISIPLAYGLTQKLIGKLPFWSIEHLIPFCIFVLIGATIISSIVVSINPKLKRLSDTEILAQATRKGNLSLVKKHWNLKNNDQYSFGDPLYSALENKQSKVAHFLLENGVDPQRYNPNFKNYQPGLTPLHTATKSGMLETMEKLIQLGVDSNIRSSNGRVPLHDLGAMDKSALQVIDLLKKYNADFAAVDKDGNTPLITLSMIHAPLEDRPLLAKKLIAYGCPKDYKNHEGKTALDIVLEQQPYERELIAVLKGEEG